MEESGHAGSHLHLHTAWDSTYAYQQKDNVTVKQSSTSANRTIDLSLGSVLVRKSITSPQNECTYTMSILYWHTRLTSTGPSTQQCCHQTKNGNTPWRVCSTHVYRALYSIDRQSDGVPRHQHTSSALVTMMNSVRYISRQGSLHLVCAASTDLSN